MQGRQTPKISRELFELAIRYIQFLARADASLSCADEGTMALDYQEEQPDKFRVNKCFVTALFMTHRSGRDQPSCWAEYAAALIEIRKQRHLSSTHASHEPEVDVDTFSALIYTAFDDMLARRQTTNATFNDALRERFRTFAMALVCYFEGVACGAFTPTHFASQS